MRLRGPGRADLILDLLIGATGIEEEVAATAERLAIGDLELPVASLESLIALKILAGRAKDQQDIGALLAAAEDGDLERARALIDLIVRRGYDRGKDCRAISTGTWRRLATIRSDRPGEALCCAWRAASRFGCAWRAVHYPHAIQ